MAYDGSEPIKSLGGELVPQVWDATLDAAGAWRVLAVADLAGQPPLAAPSSNLARTAVATGAAVPVLAGACAYGLLLTNDPDSADRLYYGRQGVDATHGDLLEPGERAWIPVSDSGGVYVLAAAAGVFYRGVRF